MANFLDEYEPVEDRLRQFWSDHPDGRVMTTLIDHADGDYIVVAGVWRSEGELPAATGLAHDSADQLPPNMKASALEVCETSAIGRALANLGYAAKGKRPSREEMSKVSPVAGGGGPPSPALDPGGSTSGEVTGEGHSPHERSSALDPSPGSSADGEAAATQPGEGGLASSSTSPGCNHKGASGRWLKTMQVEGVPVCPRCGASAIIYRESSA